MELTTFLECLCFLAANCGPSIVFCPEADHKDCFCVPGEEGR
jgi:hypothetical protein